MGRPKICNPCCGGGAGSSSSSSRGCDRCIGRIIPSMWTVTLSGIGKASCANDACDQFNRSYEMSFLGSGRGSNGTHCVWTQSLGTTTACNGASFSTSSASVSIGYIGVAPYSGVSIGFTVTITGVTTITYQKTIASLDPINCLSSHTLDFVFGGAACNGYPLTVDITPA